MGNIMKPSNPRVSVAMPIYNCQETLADAVGSILGQTYRDFELILCDDGSSDGTFSLATSLARNDNRIIVLKNERNQGLNISLNRCMEHARGEFYARMDGDDTCVPGRLAKLVEFLGNNPEIALVSSWMRAFDKKGFWGEIRTVARPTKHDFLKGSPFAHAPCMMRIKVLRELGGYGTSANLRRGQDLDLWIRMYAAGHKGANIEEFLYNMRDDASAASRRNLKARISDAKILLNGYRRLGISPVFWLWALRPILVGLVPSAIYRALRRRRLRASHHLSNSSS